MSPPFLAASALSRRFSPNIPLTSRLIGALGGKAAPRSVHAVDGVDLAVTKGEALGLVGESGCGKTTLGRMIAGILPPSDGTVAIAGQPVMSGGATPRKTTTRVQMVFQDPFASLDPRMRIGDTLSEGPVHHGLVPRAEARAYVRGWLTRVGLDPDYADRYPHQFSGGQRQRIAIARALAANPDFIICDEPTSALDVSVQAQVLNLMRDLQDQFGLTYLLITHNLAVVKHMADDVGVLYLGRLGETAPARELFARPRHPYSRMLLEAIPDLSAFGRPRQAVTGEIPNPMSPPSGCTFHPRCPLVEARCRAEVPRALPAGASLVACHVVAEREAMPLPIG